jgi:hypothetical protein
MLTFSGGFASAQDKALIGKITKKNSSVAKVMRAAGCNRSWLSQVIADSGIDPARLRKLRAGVELYLREGSSCKGSAPVQVRSLSRVILNSYANRAADQKIQGELVTLRNSAATATKKLDTLVRENQNLELQVVRLADELVKVKQAEKTARANGAQGSNVDVVASVGLIGLLSGLALMYGATQWFGRNKVSFLKASTIESAGKLYHFTLVDGPEEVRGSGVYVPRYRCEECGENNLLEKQRGRHVARAHAADRVETQIAEDLRQAGKMITRS